jgi:hypothetical protein
MLLNGCLCEEQQSQFHESMAEEPDSHHQQAKVDWNMNSKRDTNLRGKNNTI